MKLKYSPSVILLFLSLALFGACDDRNNYVSNDPDADTNAPLCYDVNDTYQQYSLFFKPRQGWVGDPMPYYENGKFHIFYLHDARDGASTFHPWYAATTTDFITYTEDGEIIPCGTIDNQDSALGTGSVFKKDGVYYAFYTGHNGKLDPREKILLATSTDLKTWNKEKDFELRAQDGYDRNEFRDPIIIKDEVSNIYRMLLSTRADYKGSWRAVIAQYTSTDLRSWKLEEPFYDDPNIFMLECPDVFTKGNYQYLVYSDINDRKVHYIYKKNGSSEWTFPTNNVLDGIAFYAGRTVSDGTHRYLLGWCPTKDRNSDYNNLGWGGSLVTHELVQQPGGTLKVSLPKTINDKLSNSIDLKAIVSDKVKVQENTYILSAGTDSQNAFSIFDRETGAFKISTRIKAGNSTSFGFLLGACGTRKEMYALTFDITNKELRLERRVKGEQNEQQTKISIPITENKEFNISLVIENSVYVIYINNEIAFSNRIYKMNQNPWGIFADNGEVLFQNLLISN